MKLIGWLLLASMITLSACQTTYIKNGQEVSESEILDPESASSDKPLVHEKRIESVINSVGYDRGPVLLRDLQWLAEQKTLAVPQVVAALERADARTKANLLYVLGFTRTPESTAALAAHLGSEVAVVRYEAAAGLLQHGDTTAVPVLVDFLENDDKRLRYKAIEALRGNTGRDFGYRFSAPEELRNVSVNRWRGWWKTEKERLMYRPWADAK